MNIGIIGANGFLGRNICLKYLELGYDVYGFYNNNYSNIPEKCKLIQLKNSTIVHFDSLFISIGNYSSKYSEFITQFAVIKSIINTLSFNKVIFISSTAVYGNHSSPIDTNSCYDNPSTYGLSKIAQEFLIKSSEKYAIIRPTYIYGSGMNKSSLIPTWINSASKNKIITIFGDGSRKQDYIHIDDLVQLCLKVATNKNNSTVLAASGKTISNLELAKLIQTYYPETNIYFQNGENGVSFEFNINDTIKYYNWKPRQSIETWLKYQNNENSNL